MVPGMSDHEGMAGIDTDIRPTYSRPKPRNINIFSKANWDQIQKDTAKFSFDYLHNLCWFDKKAKSLVRLKQILYNRAKLTGNTNDWHKYRNVKKSTNHHLKRSHRYHVNSKSSDALENNNTKPFWS